jgi:hypothetical protein
MMPFKNIGTSFILNRKKWGVGQTDGEKVRCRVWVIRVAAWVINLTVGQVFMRV